MKCPHCKAENPDGAYRCANPYCLQPLRAKRKTLVASGEMPARPPAADAPPAPDQPDTLWGRFEVEAEIGAGGMGVVYRCKDTTLDGEIVAIKVLRNELFGDPEARARLRREVQIARSLRHTRLVAVFDYFEDELYAGFAMEHLRGLPLDELMETPGWARPRSQEAVLHHLGLVAGIAAQLADALVYLHGDRNLVHRDIKPSNLMISGLGDLRVAGSLNERDARVTLMDFGIAHAAGGDRRTRLGTSGTMGYLAPELMDGSGEPSPASDMFAFGCLVYQALTGSAPTYLLPPPSSLVEGLPATVDAPVRSCFDVVARRPTDPTAIARALRRAAEEGVGGAREPLPEAQDPLPTPHPAPPAPAGNTETTTTDMGTGAGEEEEEPARVSEETPTAGKKPSVEEEPSVEEKPQAVAPLPGPGHLRLWLVVSAIWLVAAPVLGLMIGKGESNLAVFAPLTGIAMGSVTGLLLPSGTARRRALTAVGFAIAYGAALWALTSSGLYTDKTASEAYFQREGYHSPWYFPSWIVTLANAWPWIMATQALLYVHAWPRPVGAAAGDQRAPSGQVDAPLLLGWLSWAITIWWALALLRITLMYSLNSGDPLRLTQEVGNLPFDVLGCVLTGLFAGWLARHRMGPRFRRAPLYLAALLLGAVLVVQHAGGLALGWMDMEALGTFLWEGNLPLLFTSHLPGFTVTVTCLALVALVIHARNRIPGRTAGSRWGAVLVSLAPLYAVCLVLVFTAGALMNIAQPDALALEQARTMYHDGLADALESPVYSQTTWLQLALIVLAGTAAAAVVWSSISVVIRNGDRPWRDTLLVWAVLLPLGLGFFLPHGSGTSLGSIAELSLISLGMVCTLALLTVVANKPWSWLPARDESKDR